MRKHSRIFKEKKEIWKDKVRYIALCLESEESTKELLTFTPEFFDTFEFLYTKDGRNNPCS